MKRSYPAKIRFLQKHGLKLAQIAEKALRKGRLEDEEQRAKLERRATRVRKLVENGIDDMSEEQFDRTIRKLEKVLIVNEIWSPKGYMREISEAFLVAAIIAIFVRSFVAEPFKIPTGSMIPTLEIDDFIFVTKFDYGLRLPLSQIRLIDGATPDRGDVVVFDFPGEGEDQGKNFIKRIIAVPGDRVSIKDNIIHRGGEAISRTEISKQQPCSDGNGGHTTCLCDLYTEEIGNVSYLVQNHSPRQANPMCHNSAEWPLKHPGSSSNLAFGPLSFSQDSPEIIVPDEHFLVMGDNRDNSHDGRYWGFVPYAALKGKAWIIWLARDKTRIFSSVHHTLNDGDVAHAATKRTHAPE